jgi:phosphate transport system permease protein
MASLPSVVLGFLAGTVFAPFLEAWVPATLAAFATVPAAALLGSLAWQALPRAAAARWEPRKLPILVLVVVPLGLAAALPAGALAERMLFAGDVKSWLDGARGTGTGGWFLLLLPACVFAVALGQDRLVAPWCGAPVRGDRAREARREFLRYGLGGVLAVGGALVLSWGLSSLGFDPRGSFLDTFVQRNALVVGLVMGFAVIPLIYTLSEDALNAVPEHLRAASLAVGATRWQTAIRVILPTAASGLFSACMIGLGRAVGETMIVLMAAGNTPVLEWNVFNGFRTLSANIAVELPEATAYRMLFLAALALFAMTFVLNTAAEVVRQRFRKRAFEL